MVNNGKYFYGEFDRYNFLKIKKKNRKLGQTLCVSDFMCWKEQDRK